MSNMWPKNSKDYFGSFVKTITDGFSPEWEVKVVAIKGKANRKLITFIKYISFYTRILSHVLAFRYDLIYVHFPTRALLPIFLCPGLSSKMILNFHGTDLLSRDFFSRITFFVLNKRKVKLAIVPSNSAKDSLLLRLSVEEVFISPSGGVQDDWFNTTMEKVPNDPIHFVHIGNFRVEKGTKDLFAAIEMLDRENYQANFSFFGRNIDNLDLPKVERSVSVKFGGPLSREGVMNELRSSDVLVFTSYSESLGLIGLEALAMNLPVLASDITPLNEYVCDNVNGWLVCPRSSDDLYQKLVEILNNPQEISDRSMGCINSIQNYKRSIVQKELNTKLNEFLQY